MSLKNRFFSVLTVALTVVAFSTFAMAQETTTATPATEKAAKHGRGDQRFGDEKRGHKGMGKRHGKDGMMASLRGISLTDAQKAQIKSIRENNKPDEATIAELKTIRESKKAGTAITPEQQARLKAIREQAGVKAKSVHEQVQAVLTAEQKAQIEAKKVEMRQRFEERRQNRKQIATPAPTDKPVIK